MKRGFFYVVLCFCFCCENEFKDTYFENGNLKYRAYQSNGINDSIIAYNKDKSLKWIKKLYNNDSLYLWDYNNGNLLKDGIMYKNEALGKWNFYKNNYLNIVREYKWIDGGSYFNQDWYFNKSGDTLKDKGNHYKILHNEVFETNQSETIRFILEKPTYQFYDNEMIVNYEVEFIKNNNDVEKDKDEILGVNNEVIYEAIFKEEGLFRIKGYILETYRFVNDSTTEKLSRDRKLHFSKEIEVIN